MILKTGNWGRGDELQLSVIGREWKKLDPNIELFARTSKTDELFINNPNISPAGDRSGPETIIPVPAWSIPDIPAYCIAKQLGITISDYRPEIYLTDEEKEWARATLAPISNKKILAVCGHAGNSGRAYPIDSMIRLVSLLHEAEFSTIEVGQIRTMHYIRMPNVDMNFEGATSLRQVAALLSVCTAYVGAATCLFPIAEAVGTPQAIFFRPNGSVNEAYQDTVILIDDTLPCDPRCGGMCYRRPSCIARITPERVCDTVCSNFS